MRFAFVHFPTGPSLFELSCGATPHENCGGKKDTFAKVDCVSRLHANKSRSLDEDAEAFCVLDTTASESHKNDVAPRLMR